MHHIRTLDLFSGCGGFALAAQQLGIFSTTRFIEIDRDAQRTLTANFPAVPVHNDIKTYQGTEGEADLICGGFPCSGTSQAGLRNGLEHTESSLWREQFRLICQIKPKFSVIEQPVGIIDRGLRAILGGLHLAGYKNEIEVVAASELGAGHRRPRLFIVSYGDGIRFRQQPTCWRDQIGSMVERTRVNSRWLAVVRRGDGSDPRLSLQLVRGVERSSPPFEIAVPNRTRGRLPARFLAGRTVTPAQAAIALERIKYLWSIVDFP